MTQYFPAIQLSASHFFWGCNLVVGDDLVGCQISLELANIIVLKQCLYVREKDISSLMLYLPQVEVANYTINRVTTFIAPAAYY